MRQILWYSECGDKRRGMRNQGRSRTMALNTHTPRLGTDKRCWALGVGFTPGS